MNCDAFFAVKHDLLDGRLSADEADDAREHAERCEACGSDLAELERLQRDLRESASEPLPPTVHIRALRALLVAAERSVSPPAIMTVPEVAAYLRVSEPAVRAALVAIPHFTVAGETRVRREGLERWIEREELRPADLGLTGPVLTLVTSETAPRALAV